MTSNISRVDGAIDQQGQWLDPTPADALFHHTKNIETAPPRFPTPPARQLSKPIRFAGVGDLFGAYASQDLTPIDVIEHLSTTIACDPSGAETVVAMVPGASAGAEESTRRWRDGSARPLEGIPFGIKDIIDVEGTSVTCGSLLTGERIARQDAAVITHLRNAGAIPFAMTATTEFASGLPHNRRFGAVTNPWDRSKWSGGSSTGSGAALAARLLPLALGTDTAGSIRVPSSWCGTTGLKPTRDLVSRMGVAPASWTLDHVGPMARSVEDIARTLPFMTAGPEPELLAGCAELLEQIPGKTRLRIGVPVNWFNEMVDGSVLRNWRAALATFERLGCSTAPLPHLPIEQFQQPAWTIFLAELATQHRDELGRRDLFDKRVLARIEKGLELSAADYCRALCLRRQAQDMLLSAMEGVDVIIMPGQGSEPPMLLEPNSEVDGPVMIDGAAQPFIDIVPRNTVIFDLVGFPALTLPSGLGCSGLPTSIQIVARPMQDLMCLQAGAAYQRVTEYHRMAPAYLTDAMHQQAERA